VHLPFISKLYVCNIAKGSNPKMIVTKYFDHKFCNCKLILRDALRVCGASEGEDTTG